MCKSQQASGSSYSPILMLQCSLNEARLIMQLFIRQSSPDTFFHKFFEVLDLSNNHPTTPA